MNLNLLIRLLRCEQYTKNIFCLVPMFYGNELFDLYNLTRSLAVFIIFCLVSSAVYILNDIADYEQDQRHRFNSSRPIPSREVSRQKASAIGSVLCLTSLALSFLMGTGVMACVALYIFFNLLYCMKYKGVFILDLLCIAIGFELRTFAGCAAIGHQMTSFLFIEVFIFCSMMVFSKRFIERESGFKGRVTLKHYTSGLCKRAMLFLALLLNLVWIGYVFSGEPTLNMKLQNSILLGISSAFVAVSSVRYLQLVFNGVADYNFYSLLYRDRLLKVNAVSFVFVNFFALYF